MGYCLVAACISIRPALVALIEIRQYLGGKENTVFFSWVPQRCVDSLLAPNLDISAHEMVGFLPRDTLLRYLRSKDGVGGSRGSSVSFMYLCPKENH